MVSVSSERECLPGIWLAPGLSAAGQASPRSGKSYNLIWSTFPRVKPQEIPEPLQFFQYGGII